MAMQKIPKTVREAIHSAYDETCFYCKVIVAYELMEVDHFIAESTSKNEIDRLKADSIIPFDFSLTSYENLVLSCSPCNTTKSSLPLAPRRRTAKSDNFMRSLTCNGTLICETNCCSARFI